MRIFIACRDPSPVRDLDSSPQTIGAEQWVAPLFLNHYIHQALFIKHRASRLENDMTTIQTTGVGSVSTRKPVAQHHYRIGGTILGHDELVKAQRRIELSEAVFT